MTPTKDSPSSKSDSYDNEAEKILSEKMDITIEGIIRGIRTYDRALEFHRAAHRLDAKKKHKELIAEKLRELD